MDLNADIKPGMIVFGTSLNEITEVERTAAQACARVATLSRYPVTACLEAGTMAQGLLDIVEDAGFDPARVILAHLDLRLDIAYLMGIADRGAWISFDQIGGSQLGDVASKAEMLVRLADAGYEDQLLISQGLSGESNRNAHGGSPCWIHLLERFTLELLHAGASWRLVHKLLTAIQQPP